MIVRRLQPGDEQIACAVIIAAKPQDERHGHEPDAIYMSEFLAMETNFLIGAYQDDTPLGFAIAYQLPRIERPRHMMYLHEIAVVETGRGRGVGSRLMKELVRISRARGHTEVFVITDRRNAAAVRLYTGSGGVQLGEDSTVFCYVLDRS